MHRYSRDDQVTIRIEQANTVTCTYSISRHSRMYLFAIHNKHSFKRDSERLDEYRPR